MESIERDSFVHNKSWGVGWSSVAHGFFAGKSTVIQQVVVSAGVGADVGTGLYANVGTKGSAGVGIHVGT